MAFQLHPRLPVFLRSTDGGASWRIIDAETNNPVRDEHGDYLDGGGFAGCMTDLPVNGEYMSNGELTSDDGGPRLGTLPFSKHGFASRLNMERGLSSRVRYEVTTAKPASVGSTNSQSAARQSDRPSADTKTDKEKKLPRNSEIVKAAKFVRLQREKLQREGTPTPTLIDILTEFTNGNRSKAESLRRALQPSRYGWLLDLSADK